MTVPHVGFGVGRSWDFWDYGFLGVDHGTFWTLGIQREVPGAWILISPSRVLARVDHRTAGT